MGIYKPEPEIDIVIPDLIQAFLGVPIASGLKGIRFLDHVHLHEIAQINRNLCP